MNNLYNDYCIDCLVGKPHEHDKRINLSSKGDRTLFEKVWNAAKRAYSILHATGKYTASDIAEYSELINATNDVFVKAIERGVKSNVIPARMMTSLENDVFVFSALKTHAQLFEASRQLLTDDGKVKSFQQFSQDIAKIEKDYNQAYLQAEYNFAVSSAQQAANWAKIEESGDRYNLQYRTAGDDRVRDSHEALNGITLPPSDAFWNSYYPPNGWNCRCVAVEVLKEKYPESDSETAVKKGEAATMQIGKDGKNRMEIFRFNPGKEKVIFPQNHPYNKLQGVDYVKDLKYRDLVFNIPLEKQYSSVYNSSNGGKVLVHDLADIKAPRVKSDDYLDRIEVAKAFAKQGHTVRVLPEIHLKDVNYRAKVLKGLNHESANPDFFINGKYMDLKRPENVDNILYNANKAWRKQNSIAVITDKFMEGKVLENDIKERIEDIFNQVKSNDVNKQTNYLADELFFIHKGKLTKYKRQ